MIKISMPCLRLSSSGVMATRVKMFHISLSGYSKRASNSILKCIILFGVSCFMLPSSIVFKTARERVKEATISTTNFAWCIEQIIGIDSSFLKWSQEKKMGFYGIKFQRSFKIGERSFKEKKNDHGNYFFWLISAIKAII